MTLDTGLVDYCLYGWGRGYQCTLLPGHVGDHEAGGTDPLLTCPNRDRPRACSWSECGKVLHAAAGFYELYHQPTGELESFCSVECLHWQLHEDLR